MIVRVRRRPVDAHDGCCPHVSSANAIRSAVAGALRENGIVVKDADCSPDTAKIGERITCSFRGAVPSYGFNIPVHGESTALSMAYTKSRSDR